MIIEHTEFSKRSQLPDEPVEQFITSSLVVKSKKWTIPKKNGAKINLVSLDVEFSAEQQIQNPLKSTLGKNSCYNI